MNSSELKEKSRTIDFSSRAHQGERNYQEDSCAFAKIDSGLLAVLSDGMGGHAAGDVASKLAVETFIESFLSSNEAEHFRFGAALALANAAINRSVERNPDQEGMGCTLLSVFIKGDELQWVSVGDSPLFLFRSGKIIRLNADHSMTPVIEKALKDGRLTQNEAESHPNRHALRSALTGGELELVDLSESPFRLKTGDLLIVASDGLLTLTENMIQSQLRSISHMSSEDIAKSLIKSVLDQRHPRQDNITIQIIKPNGQVSKRAIHLVPIISIIFGLLLISAYLFSDVITKEFNGLFKSVADTPPKSQEVTYPVESVSVSENKPGEMSIQVPKAISKSSSSSTTPTSQKNGLEDKASKEKTDSVDEVKNQSNSNAALSDSMPSSQKLENHRSDVDDK